MNNQKKRVLILIGDPHFNFEDEKSAVLSFLTLIAEAFTTAGCEVTVNNRILGQNSEKKASTPVVASKNKGLKAALKRWRWLYYSLAQWRTLKNQELLFDELKKGEKADLIVEYHIVGSTIGVELAKLWGASYSVIFDSPGTEQYLNFYGTRTAFWSRMKAAERMSFEYAECMLCYSPACKDYLQENFCIKASIGILPSRLFKDVFVRKKTETFNVGFIGSFLKWHKVQLLVEVFSEFHRKHNDSKLILLGYGQEWSKVKALVEEMQLQDAVVIPGFVSEEELREFKGQFTIGVMPGSNWYGSPLKLFEYAEMGIPFIAPVSKTVDSVFEDEKHCLYVKETNERDSLMIALTRFYEDNSLRDRLGNAARDWVNTEYGKEAYYSKMVNILMSNK